MRLIFSLTLALAACGGEGERGIVWVCECYYSNGTRNDTLSYSECLSSDVDHEREARAMLCGECEDLGQSCSCDKRPNADCDNY